MLKPLSRYKKEIDIVNSKSTIPNTFYYMLTDVLSLNLKDALFEIKKCFYKIQYSSKYEKIQSKNN